MIDRTDTFVYYDTTMSYDKMSELTKSRIEIEELRDVNNPSSVHGIFPYRGKISAKDAKKVIIQLQNIKKNGVLFDPFCGTGTILYEGFESGLSVLGIDNNPLAIWIAKGKRALNNQQLTDVWNEFDNLYNLACRNKFELEPTKLMEKAFHSASLKEISMFIPFFEVMSDYLKAAFIGSIALTARGCNNYLWTSNSVGKDIHPKRYINFIEKFKAKIKKHFHPLHNGKGNYFNIYEADTRNMDEFIKDNSVDFVFTSPPYFDALDYTAYYGRIVYDLLSVNTIEIKEGLIQQLSNYKESMQIVLNKLVRVVRDDGIIVFVVGDKKLKDEIVNGGDFFSNLLHHKPSKIIEREYTKTTSQLFDNINKTKRKEQIVIWDKKDWQ